MELRVVDEDGVRVVEGAPKQRFMARPDDASLLIEACWSHRVRGALLYPENLTDGFFDLSSGDAGAILQQLRNYGVSLALVSPTGSIETSSRFGEMVSEEQRRDFFRIFDTRQGARAWLATLVRK